MLRRPFSLTPYLAPVSQRKEITHTVYLQRSRPIEWLASASRMNSGRGNQNCPQDTPFSLFFRVVLQSVFVWISLYYHLWRFLNWSFMKVNSILHISKTKFHVFFICSPVANRISQWELKLSSIRCKILFPSGISSSSGTRPPIHQSFHCS